MMKYTVSCTYNAICCWLIIAVVTLLSTNLVVDCVEQNTVIGLNGEIIENNNNNDQYDVNPQQTCQEWTIPGYKSASRLLESAPALHVDDILTDHTMHEASCMWEPNLIPMNVQFSGGYSETFYAYKTPDVALFYNYTAGSKKVTIPQYNGMIVKFINMSPNPIQIYWVDSRGGGGNILSSSSTTKYMHIMNIEPFSSAATASSPKHTFIVSNSTSDDPNHDILMKYNIELTNSLYYYDPYHFDIKQAKGAKLNDQQLHMYHIQLVNRAFAYQYKLFTGIDWLALYKHRNPPRYHMWRCDSIGQTYSIDTYEIHYTELPPEYELHRGTSVYGPRPDELERMRPYKATQPILNLTLKALSCSPRVFEIQNFLSNVEVDHILHNIIPTLSLSKSTTSATSNQQKNNTSETRTSRTSWIARNTDMIIDGIHRRAADVLQIHESLLRWRRPTEIPEFPDSMISIAERLQVVHYEEGQQYTPHHDFSMPNMVKDQPARYATMLFYLNDDMIGGETTFPRWLHSEKSNGPLTIKPKKGKAILFYNMLPDGNFDERSLHAALKVIKGEKYLMNLWLWDPILDHTTTENI